MKITRVYAREHIIDFECPETLGNNILRALFFLQHALDNERGRRSNQATIAFVHGRIDDNVHEAGLVLEREKYEPFRRAGSLTGNHHAADFTNEMIRHRLQSLCGKGATALELGAKMRDRLQPRRYARTPEIEARLLARRKRCERGRRFVDVHAARQFAARSRFVEPP